MQIILLLTYLLTLSSKPVAFSIGVSRPMFLKGIFQTMMHVFFLHILAFILGLLLSRFAKLKVAKIKKRHASS